MKMANLFLESIRRIDSTTIGLSARSVNGCFALVALRTGNKQGCFANRFDDSL